MIKKVNLQRTSKMHQQQRKRTPKKRKKRFKDEEILDREVGRQENKRTGIQGLIIT